MQLRDPLGLLLLWARVGTIALVGVDSRALEGRSEAGDPLDRALDRTERALRKRLAIYDGVELDTDQDYTFLAVFEDPGNALRFALGARDRADRIRSGQGGDAVQIGAHLAVAPRQLAPRELGRGLDDELEVLEKITASATAGQVLLTGPLWRASQHAAPLGLLVNELGHRRLSGVEGAIELVELRLSDQGSGATDLSTEPAEVTNLSPHPSTFVGRDRELRELDRLLSSGARLITLHGPPGVGKSRLAARYAALHLYRFPGGALRVELPGLTTPAALLLAMSDLLGVPSESHRDQPQAARQLGHALRSRGSILLLLDGVERLGDGAAEVLGQWLLASPDTRLLVTSRERLGLDGEVVSEVGPMQPGDAAALFLRRLGEARPNVDLSAAEHLAVAEVVERLDRLPLALELAAARAATLSPTGLLAQLARAQGSRAALSAGGGARANTLQHALDLTWTALSEVEQDALAQLTVFRGGFDLEAADLVVDLSHHEDQPWLLDVVEALCDRSLLRAEPALHGDTVRFHIFGLIREYASRKLVRAARRQGVERRHQEWIIALGEELGMEIDLPGGERALRRLVQERDNLEAAAASALRLPRDPEAAVRALFAMVPIYRQRLPLDALHGLLDTVVRESAELPAAWRVRALIQRAEALRLRGRQAAAAADLEEAARWLPHAGATDLEAALLVQTARIRYAEGGLEAAMSAITRAVATARAAGDRVVEAQALYTMATVWMARCQLGEADSAFASARQIYQDLNLQRPLAQVLTAQARLYAEQLRFDDAQLSLASTLLLDADMLPPGVRITALRSLGALLLDLGRLTEAERPLRESLELARRVGARVAEGSSLYCLGLLHLERGEMEEAESCLVEAVTVTDEVGLALNSSVARVNLGLLRLVQGRLAEAGERLAEAVHTMERSQYTQGLHTSRGWLAVALAALGRAAEARRAIVAGVAEAQTALPSRDGMTVRLCEVLVGLYLARQGGPDRAAAEGAARARLAEARTPEALPGDADGRGLAPMARSTDVRLAARLVEEALARGTGG